MNKLLRIVSVSIFIIGCSFLNISCNDSRDSTRIDDRQLNNNFFFLQMTDTQFGMFARLASKEGPVEEGFAKETELFEKAIAHANRLKPAFVVICGDLIQTGADEKQNAEFLRICGLLDKSIPLYLLSGNHDVSSSEHLAYFRKNIGPDWYSFYNNGSYGIVLNTTIIVNQPDGAEAQKQLAWLKSELAKAADRNPAHIFVFMHHPIFLNDPNEEDSYYNFSPEQRKIYLSLFSKYNVTAVFTGHLHSNSLSRYGDIEMITTGPVGKPLGKDPSGFRVVKVYEDHIEHKYYGLDEVPENIEIQRK